MNLQTDKKAFLYNKKICLLVYWCGIMKNKLNCFFIILPEVEIINANVVIKRIMDKWENTSFSDHIKISYSFDCAQYKDE